MIGVGCSLLWIYPMHPLWPLVVDYLTHDTYIVYVYDKGGHFMNLDVPKFCHRSDSIGIGILVNVHYI